MISLSVLLKARASRLINIIVAIALVPYMLFNLAGEAWPHMIFAAIVEVVLLALIVRTAVKWPTSQK
jgi:hypothetical protein